MELNLIHKNNLFKMHLSMLCGIKFTTREIDIISCITKNRAEKKIAQLLDISPRTVGSHVHNIMCKIGCNSKDQIIDLIEKSGKEGVLQQYYQSIITNSHFKSALEKISKYIEVNEKNEIYINEISTRNTLFIKILANHLSILGWKLSFDKEGKNNLFNLSIKDFNINNRSYFQLIFEIITKLIDSEEVKKIRQSFLEEIDNLGNSYSPLPNNGLSRSDRAAEYDMITKLVLATVLIMAISTTLILLVKNTSRTYLKKYNFEMNDITTTNHLARREIFMQLDKVFENRDEVNVAMLVGAGGAGKTFLTKQYGVKKNFDLVWVHDVGGEMSFISSLEQMALELAEGQEDRYLLSNITQRDKIQKRRNLMHFVQQKLKNLKKWLVIFDNVQSYSEVREFLALDGRLWGHGAVIINTTNRMLYNHMNFPEAHMIEVPELTDNEKMQLFCSTINGSNLRVDCGKSKVKDFLEHIPSFPLDVTIAANYLKQERISIDKYLEYLKNNEKDFIFTQQGIIQDITDYHKTRYDIIALSVKQILEEREEKYLDFLIVTSMIHNTNIDVDFLLGLHNEILVREFLNSMQKYSMIIEEVKGSDQLTKQFSLHRYTQSMILSYLKTKYSEETINSRIATIARSFKKYLADIQLSNQCKDLKSVIFHLETFLSKIPDQSDGTFLEIHKIIGDFYYHLGSYDLAEKKVKSVYNTYQDTLGKGHIKTILTQSLLGIIYRNAGKYKNAKILLEDSYKNVKDNNQASVKEVAWVMTFLGSVYRNTGQFEKSTAILQEALALYKSVPDSRLANIMTCKLYLAITYQVIDNHKAAEGLLLEVLDYYLTHLTYNISKPVWVKGRLALLYMDTGRFKESEEILKENLKFYTKNFSRESLEAAWIMVQLGKLYYNIDQIEIAEKYLKEALDIYRVKHADVHNVAFGWVYYHMALIEIKKGLLLEAKKYLAQSHMIYAKFYGTNHVKTAKIKDTMKDVDNLLSET